MFHMKIETEFRPIPMNRLKQLLGRRCTPFCVIGLVSLILWGHTMQFELVWDDRYFIEENQSIRSLSSIPDMFLTKDAQSSFPEGFVLFRPLRTVHYCLLYLAGGGDSPKAWLYHLTNILWHAVAGMLLFSVLRIFMRRVQVETEDSILTGFALLGAIAFVVHPVGSEVVCWAKSLDDIMATVFTLASLRCLLLWRNSKYPLVALLFFVLAVYSKVSALPFVLVAFAVFSKFHGISISRSFRLSTGFLGVALIFLVHRHWIIGHSSQTEPISGNYWQTLLDMLPVVPEYFRLLFGAPPFLIDYTFMKGGYSVLDLPVVVGFLLLGALALATRFLLKHPVRWPVGVGILWVGLFLLPVSNVLPMMQYMAERFLYLPLLGAIMALTLVLFQISKRRQAACVFGLLLVVWSGLSWDRSWIWSDDVTLFGQSCLEGPRNDRMRKNAVAAILDQPVLQQVFRNDDKTDRVEVVGQMSPDVARQIIPILENANQLIPDTAALSSTLAIAYALNQQPLKAIPLFRFALRINPNDILYKTNLAQAFTDASQLTLAKEMIESVLAVDPTNRNALTIASSVYWRLEDYQSAIYMFNNLLLSDPDNKEHQFWLEQAKEKLEEQAESAEKTF